jgi:cysteine synthase B
VELHVKCEWFNPGGSVKDRAAASIVLDAERRGVLRPGATILDASSGNTGIAYAWIAAERGYRLVLCLPRNANTERRQLLAAYGATLIDTDPLEGSDGAIREARRLAGAHPDWVYLDQYGNNANWRAHMTTTGPELIEQTGGRLTHVVATVGTSGTLMGLSRYLHGLGRGIQTVEVQPDSPFHGIEGLKRMDAAIVPAIYDAATADRRIDVATEDAYARVRQLAREGLLVGPSGGAAVQAAVALGKTLEQGLVVAMMPDGGARYLSDEHIWQEG